LLRDWASGPRSQTPRLLYSSRALEQVIFRTELDAFSSEGVGVHITLTRDAPADWRGHRGRIDSELLNRLAFPAAEDPIAYVCGPNGFVETASQTLLELGYPPARIKTERFGPSGN